MKKLLFFFLFAGILSQLFAQAPERVNYQAVVRDNGAIMANQSLNATFIIHQGSTSNPVYTEQKIISTNAYGVLAHAIGTGISTDTFSTIDWGNGTYFLEVEIDPGTGAVSLGTTELISVPYSLFAKEAGIFKGPAGGDLAGFYPNPRVAGIQTYPVSSQMPTFGQVLKWEGSQWIPSPDASGKIYTAGPGISLKGDTITNTAQDQLVVLMGAGSTTVSGTYPNFTISSTDSVTTYSGGSGISVSGTTITNTLPDQVVTLTAAGATSISGSYPNFTVSSTDSFTTYSGGTGIDVTGATITNTAPDQTVTLLGNGATSISGNYPVFTISSTDSFTTYTGGTGISVSGSTITNTAPDQTVTLTGTGATTVTGTYPSFTVNSTDDVNDADSDPSNEIQTLTLNDTTLSLSNGGVVSLAPFVSPWTVNGSDIYRNLGNVGISTPTPIAALNVGANADVLFGSSFSGNGAKVIWDYSRQAFRAGFASNNSWDEDSLGLYSAGFGLSTVASAYMSFATGFGTRAKTYAGFAIGQYNEGRSGTSFAWNIADPLFEVGNGTSNSNRNNAFTILKNGRVGINNATPLFLLDIENTQLLPRSININQTVTSSASTQYGIYVDMTNSASSGALSYGANLDILSSNHSAVGILSQGRSDASGSFHAYGVHAIADNDNGNGVAYGVFGEIAASTSSGAKYAGYFSGNVYTTGSYLPSDVQLKKDIAPLSSTLDKLLKLEVKTYAYDREKFPRMNLPEGQRAGFIAQELEQVMPELVAKAVQPATQQEELEEGEAASEEVEFKAVDYAGMVPYLVKALQEQQAQIEALKQRIAELEQE